MRKNKPSLNAMRVAIRRAAHQIIDNPKEFDDPISLKIIVGAKAGSRLHADIQDTSIIARYLRAFMAVRSRYAEDELELAISSGTSQYVILGAGLDTFAYRHRYPENSLRVFEVDHPDTQQWKRSRLSEAGIAIPNSLT